MSMYISNDDNNNNNNNNNNNSNTSNNTVAAAVVGNSVFFPNNNKNGTGVSCVKTASTTAESRMNLAALQQRDPYITDIVDTAKQVALYFFSSKESEWEKTSVEGTLFVYRRSASPDHRFMILNRLKPNNLIEPIQKDLEFQLHDPFLLYRTTKAIYGIWFYDKDECVRVGRLVNSLLQVAIANHKSKFQLTTQSRASDSETVNDQMSIIKNEPIMDHQIPGSVDTIQLLSKAQHEYNKVKWVTLLKIELKKTKLPTSAFRFYSIMLASSTLKINKPIHIQCNKQKQFKVVLLMKQKL